LLTRVEYLLPAHGLVPGDPQPESVSGGTRNELRQLAVEPREVGVVGQIGERLLRVEGAERLEEAGGDLQRRGPD
jgi:hypothetical protein